MKKSNEKNRRYSKPNKEKVRKEMESKIRNDMALITGR